MALVFVGALLVVIGVFLPWAEYTATLQGLGSVAQSVTGFDMNEGIISTVIAVAEIILGFIAAKAVQPKVVGSLIIIASAAVIVITGNLVISGGQNTMTPIIEVGLSLQPGVYLTLIGGVILLIGGLMTTFKSE